MSHSVKARQGVALGPEPAWRLWTSVERWPTFIEGFARVLERRGDWPAAGSQIVWESIPTGRGRVTEKVAESAPGIFTTDVFEGALTGRQTITFEPVDGGAIVDADLTYELANGGPLKAVTDFVFIRRALTSALDRTLQRFATEADEEAALAA